MLLIIKKKNDIGYESFEGCDDKLKYDLLDVTSQEDNLAWDSIAIGCSTFEHWHVSHVYYGEFGNQK